jgi:hypothetical protein
MNLCVLFYIAVVYSIDNKHPCTVVLARKGLNLMFKELLVTYLWSRLCTLIKKKIKYNRKFGKEPLQSHI